MISIIIMILGFICIIIIIVILIVIILMMICHHDTEYMEVIRPFVADPTVPLPRHEQKIKTNTKRSFWSILFKEIRSPPLTIRCWTKLDHVPPDLADLVGLLHQLWVSQKCQQRNRWAKSVGRELWHALVCGVRIQVRHAFCGKTHDRQHFEKLLMWDALGQALVDKKTMVLTCGKMSYI